MNLDIPKARLLQHGLQLHITIDGHAADFLRPLVSPARVPAALIADEECSAGLQHTSDLPEASENIGPEINRLKGGNDIEPIGGENNAVHAALPDDAAPCVDCRLVYVPRRVHADRGIVDALDNALGTLFQHPLDVCTAAAAAVQNPGIRGGGQKLQPPTCQGMMANVHHADHHPPADPLRLTGIFKK